MEGGLSELGRVGLRWPPGFVQTFALGRGGWCTPAKTKPLRLSFDLGVANGGAHGPGYL